MIVSLVIPFYNEEENVEIVIKELIEQFQKVSIEYEIIAVNNNSKDRTGEILDELVNRYDTVRTVFEKNPGYGNAIRAGLSAANGKWIGWTDGDRQISSEDVLKVIKKAIDEDAVFCKTERVERNDGFFRRVYTWLYRQSVSLMLRTKMYDVNGKPKIFLKSWYEGMQLQSNGWFIDAELIALFLAKGSSIESIPIKFLERTGGESSVNIKSVFNLWKEMFAFIIRRNKTHK